MCASLLALWLLQAQPIERMVERLRSDDPAEREAASSELAELGRTAMPTLKQLESDGSAEVRARATGIIREIERRERILAIRPASKRLTLELKDVPVREAVTKVFEAFGLSAFASSFNDPLPERKVTLQLKDATLWTAYDAFCDAAKATCDERSNWLFHSMTQKDSESKRFDSGDVRIIAYCESNEKLQCYLAILLPACSMPLCCVWKDARVFDGSGRDLGVKASDGPHNSAARTRRWVTRAFGGHADVEPGALRDAKTVRIEGTLVITWPHDYERAELKIQGGELAGKRRLFGQEVDIRWKGNAEGWSLELKTHALDSPKTFLAWVEDEKGSWLFDAGSHWGDLETSCAESCDASASAKLVFARSIGEDTVKIPFVIKDVPLPLPRNK